MSVVNKQVTQQETAPKKKSFRQIEKEVQEIFDEIGREVQQEINKKKGGNDYGRK